MGRRGGIHEDFLDLTYQGRAVHLVESLSVYGEDANVLREEIHPGVSMYKNLAKGLSWRLAWRPPDPKHLASTRIDLLENLVSGLSVPELVVAHVDASVPPCPPEDACIVVNIEVNTRCEDNVEAHGGKVTLQEGVDVGVEN